MTFGVQEYSLSTCMVRSGETAGLVRTLAFGTHQGRQVSKYKCPEDNWKLKSEAIEAQVTAVA